MQFCTKDVHGKSLRHRTRLILHGGVRLHFPTPEVDAEILVSYARNILPITKIRRQWFKLHV